MKSFRFALAIVLVALSTAAFAQSDSQKSFEALKSLAGSWQGPVAVEPPLSSRRLWSSRAAIARLSCFVVPRSSIMAVSWGTAGFAVAPYIRPASAIPLTATVGTA